MPGIDNYFAFLLAGILLNLTPGADTIYILSRSIAQGKKAGIVSVLGIATGTCIHTLFAAFGLSLILAQSSVLFHTVQYVGAAYLVFLGIKLFVSESSFTQQLGVEHQPLLTIYRQAVLTNVLNPKVALFFLSFLPQFINPEYAHGPLPFLILGFSFLTTGTLWCLVIAYSASFMTERLRRNELVARAMTKVCGMVFVALGLQLAFKK
jgi:threonine/homoserine/homoserine lactone efflux protein